MFWQALLSTYQDDEDAVEATPVLSGPLLEAKIDRVEVREVDDMMLECSPDEVGQCQYECYDPDQQ